ncbi:MAG: hypothetical protein ABUL62_30665 [Myxococcales bacterium]
MRSSRIWSAVAFTVALSVHASAQQVDDATRSAARQLATDGSAAYQADDYAQAYDRFNRAYQLVHVPTVGIWAARSLLKLGRLVEASERYLDVSRTPLAADAPPEHFKAQKDANEERARLMPRIPNVRVLLDGADASETFVSLNDELLPSALLGVNRPVNPGKLRVKGVRGEQVVEAAVDLPEGASKDVTLTFTKLSHVKPSTVPGPAEAPPPTAPPPQLSDSPDHTLAYVAFGVGGAVLITGGIFGGLALSQKSDLDAQCPNRQCTPAHHSDNDSYETKKLVSGVGLIAGAALVGAGVVLYFTAPAPAGEQHARLGAFCNGQQLGVQGAF